TKFEFSDGITSLLGPNGRGKSNVVDSVKWVLGTQALSSIRASKKDDVIFNGTDTRKPMQMCEVILTLNNEHGQLNIDATEVEIKRRAFRNGDNEYYINREKVLLRNIRELFMDTGVGKAAYSILEQGKIDQILLMKPEDRRYIFEEASGISRFKQQSEEAGRKLQKTDENMAQVDLLLKEAEKLYNSRKGQLEKVLKHRELSAEKERLEVELQLSYVQSLTKLKDFRQKELDNLEDEQRSIDAILDSARTGLDQQQNELEQLRSQRENLSGQCREMEERVNSIKTSIEVYNERFQEISQRSKDARFRAQQVQDRIDHDKQRLDEKQADYESTLENIRLTDAGMEKATEEIEKLKADRIRHQLDIDDLEKANDEIAQQRVSITAEISELANAIANSLEENIKGSGYSSTVRSKAEKELLAGISKARNILIEKVDFLRNISKVDFEKEVFQNAIDEAEESLLEQIDEIKGLFQEYSGTIPTFLDDFTSPEGTLARKEQLDVDLSKSYENENANRLKVGDLSTEIERLNRLVLLKESDYHDLEMDKVQFQARADSLKSSIMDLKGSLQQMEFDYSDASHSVEAEESKVNEILERIDDLKNRKDQTLDEIEEIKLQLADVNAKIDQLSQKITDSYTQFQGKFQRKQDLVALIATAKENIRSIQENIQKIYTDFFDNTQKSLREFNDHEITMPVDELKSKLDTTKRRIQDLGYINYMAEDEYNEAKKNYDFYSKNMDDLKKAKNDLEEVIAEIRRRSEQMFLETYGQISENFQEMFTTLFGGGKAELMLTDEENVLESGIDIKAQPPGKKMLQLNLLSGGERSMTAVALLFATYMVKPSPFCILDEIDAALDTRNIGSFMRVLDKFEDKSQFIIITHNKGTVMGSDCLLGVTQQEPGVSKMIGYKIEDIENLDEHDTLKG
ncbi:MAG: AAA family ATPase, partial [Spirochaetales bacterium]|nr:AAA family ATPase [Spirochaetales bacterium]